MGIEEDEYKRLTRFVYVDQTQNKAVIKGHELASIEKTMLYNSDGKAIAITPLVELDQITLDVASLSAGIYILEITSAQKVFRYKFVRN